MYGVGGGRIQDGWVNRAQTKDSLIFTGKNNPSVQTVFFSLVLLATSALKGLFKIIILPAKNGSFKYQAVCENLKVSASFVDSDVKKGMINQSRLHLANFK